MTEKYLLIYHVDRDANDTWIGTLDEYEKFSAKLDEEFSEDGWSMDHFSKMSDPDVQEIIKKELRIHHSREDEGKFDPPCFSWCQWLHDGCEQEIDQYSFCKDCVKEALEIYDR